MVGDWLGKLLDIGKLGGVLQWLAAKPIRMLGAGIVFLLVGLIPTHTAGLPALHPYARLAFAVAGGLLVVLGGIEAATSQERTGARRRKQEQRELHTKLRERTPKEKQILQEALRRHLQHMNFVDRSERTRIALTLLREADLISLNEWSGYYVVENHVWMELRKHPELLS